MIKRSHLIKLHLKRRPAPSKVILFGLTALLLVGWLPQFASFIPPTSALELLLLMASLLAAMTMRVNAVELLLIVISSLYLLFSCLYALLILHVNVFDFIQANKSFFYILLLVPFSRRSFFDALDLRRILTFSLYMFLVVYAWKRFLFNDHRPTLLVENNFELIFLVLLFYASYVSDGKIQARNAFLLALVVAISGSRSVAVIAVVVLFFCMEFKFTFRSVTIFSICLLSAIAAVAIFTMRSHGTIEDIDRYKFMQQFLYATRGWGGLDYLIGTPRLTPLPAESCRALSYYQSLFSYAGDGACYSVILHSFNLRVVYDHGLAGLFFLIYGVWNILALRTRKSRVCVIIVILLSGMSVSSLNNVYVALSLAILASIGSSVSFVKKANMPAEFLSGRVRAGGRSN